MAVKIRMTRKGSRHNPYFRIVAADERSPRDGKYIELLGTYDPQRDPAAVSLKMDRIQYWLSKGAVSSETVSQLIERNAAPQK